MSDNDLRKEYAGEKCMLVQDYDGRGHSSLWVCGRNNLPIQRHRPRHNASPIGIWCRFKRRRHRRL